MKIYIRLKSFIKDPISFLDKVKLDGPDVQRTSIGPKRFIFVFCADAAREVLVTKGAVFIQNRSIFDKIKPLTGKKGLVQLEGVSSKEARTSGRTIFSSKAIQRSISIIEKNCDHTFSKLKMNDEVEPSKLMMELVLENALEIFLGVENKKIQKEMGEVFLRLHKLCGKRMLNPFALPLCIPFKKSREIKNLSKSLKYQLREHLTLTKTFPEGSIPYAYNNDPKLIDHCMTFLFAGHETTASSLAFTLLLLSKSREGQKQILEGSDLDVLSIYKESLRLYPPAYMLVRQASKDCQLKNIKIKKGDEVIIGLKQILSSEQYFSNPTEFLTNRFLSKNKERDRAFFPFGLGGKSCIGEQLAYVEAKVILRTFFKHFNIEIEQRDIEAKPMVTLHPNGGQTIKLIKRDLCL